MESLGYDCRFCLRQMSKDEKTHFLENEIKSQFKNLTSIDLDENVELSQVVCEVCLRSVQLANALKVQFVENQLKLCGMNESGESQAHQAEYSNESHQKHEYFVVSSLKRQRTESTNSNSISDSDLLDESQAPEEDMTFCEPIVGIKVEEDELTAYEPNFTNSMNKTPGRPKKNRILVNKVYRCLECEKIYNNKTHLDRHVETSHKKSKFPCIIPGCTQDYTRKDKLRRHILEKHSDLPPMEMEAMLEKLKTLSPIYGSET